MDSASIVQTTLTTNTATSSLPKNAQNMETVPIDKITLTTTTTIAAALSDNSQNMETESIDQNTLTATVTDNLSENTQNMETVSMDQNTLTTTVTATLSENTQNMETVSIDQNTLPVNTTATLLQKRMEKQQKYNAKKTMGKEKRKMTREQKKKEWQETLASVDEEERKLIIQSSKWMRRETMYLMRLVKEDKEEKLKKAQQFGQNVVIDLEFAHLMAPSELRSLVKQIVLGYGVNEKSTSPCHLWLTGCNGEMETRLNTISGFGSWIIEKKNAPYIEALQDKKDKLVYLIADSETVLEELDETKIYIVGGLWERNRWKYSAMKKANEQGIQTAKLPIGNYLKMAGLQGLNVNQVIQILLKYQETKDWKESFFDVFPKKRRFESESKQVQQGENKKLCT